MAGDSQEPGAVARAGLAPVTGNLIGAGGPEVGLADTVAQISPEDSQGQGHRGRGRA